MSFVVLKSQVEAYHALKCGSESWAREAHWGWRNALAAALEHEFYRYHNSNVNFCDLCQMRSKNDERHGWTDLNDDGISHWQRVADDILMGTGQHYPPPIEAYP